MANVDALMREYARFVALPWQTGLSGAEKVWFALYAPADERRLRRHLPEFEIATRDAGHGWQRVDLTDAFARWMAAHEYRDAYFDAPDLLEEMALDGFAQSCATRVTVALDGPETDEHTVVAVTGAASLFGLTRVSRLVEAVAERVRGRLLVFFPGEYVENKYRLLDARDGWNYRATPIMAREGGTT